MTYHTGVARDRIDAAVAAGFAAGRSRAELAAELGCTTHQVASALRRLRERGEALSRKPPAPARAWSGACAACGEVVDVALGVVVEHQVLGSRVVRGVLVSARCVGSGGVPVRRKSSVSADGSHVSPDGSAQSTEGN